MIKKQIVRIDKELNKVIKQDPDIFQKVKNLKTMPGCEMLLAANLIVVTDNFTRLQNPKQSAAFIGIVPYQHQSGSVFRKPRIRHFGPQYIRKLLRLGSQSVATHNKTFRSYYLRKLTQGKAKALVLIILPINSLSWPVLLPVIILVISKSINQYILCI